MDAADDPFSPDIGSSSLWRSAGLYLTKGLLTVLFSVGLALGFQMRITRHLASF